jgi:2-dehydropantoate 2-reductase
MRILIVGAGAVGGFFGAHLLNAQRDVTFLVRPGRARQLAADGLLVVNVAAATQSAPTQPDLHIPSPKTILASEIAEPFDLILLSCKAYDLESSIADLAPAVGPDGAILPLLNGISHLDVLDARFGRRHVLGGDTTVSTVKQPDGRILLLNDLDALHFGDRDEPHGPRIQRIAHALAVPGFTAELCPDILAAMWHKWIAISTAASATCLLRCTIGDIVAAGQTQVVHEILGETSAISAAAGYPPPPACLDNLAEKFTRAGSPFTASMFRDISVNARIEAKQILGDLLAHARRHAVPTPILNLVHAHLLCYEARRARELAS